MTSDGVPCLGVGSPSSDTGWLIAGLMDSSSSINDFNSHTVVEKPGLPVVYILWHFLAKGLCDMV